MGSREIFLKNMQHVRARGHPPLGHGRNYLEYITKGHIAMYTKLF